MPIAAIALDFDPILRLGDMTIRWQAVALTGVILLALVLTAVVARAGRLRSDDLLFVAVGVVPGAVIGGRIGYVLAHADFYAANPGAIIDPAQGSASLSLAVLGGLLTGGVVARLLGTPIRPWLHAASLPVLLAIGLGKLSMVLAGSGQGAPAAVDWATSFRGTGPWGSLGADIPSHPSQIYEALGTLLVVVLMAALLARTAGRVPTGRAFLLGLAGWAAVRFVVGFTWRDAPVIGPIGAEQLLTLLVAATCAGLILVRPSDARAGPTRPGTGPAWPEPASRPRF